MQNPKFKGFVISLFMVAPALHAAEYSIDQLNALVQQAQYKQALSTEGNNSAALTNDPNATDDNPNATDNAASTAKNPNTTDFETQKPPPKVPTLRDRAFKELMDKISPLTPEQILQMRQQEDKTQQAIATTPNTPPIPVSSTLTVDLSPGITPPVVRLASGFVTSLVFVDSSGQPWPIADYSLGNPGDFNIQWDKKAHTLFIQSTTTYSSANLAIRLAKLDTPVMISLVSGQKYVDYRVDLQVQGRGPNALAPMTGDALPNASPLLLNALDGIPPPGSQELEVSGGLGRAWLSGGKLIFRTQLIVLSPAWSTIASSPDGTRVYEMIQTPLILASHNGKPIEIVIKGL
ncbi:MAG: type IV secretion protein IcmK [Gammaproteobacteria bacterium]|nr:type IV secretion protein IcmK [Gammaproteobacteria bacterium]